jgi:outer membrane scaffolding protein for murein synthesis (MipA/OmpV family)
MKKLVIVAVLFLGFTGAVYAQELTNGQDVQQNPIRYPGLNQGDTTPGTPSLPQDLELTVAAGVGTAPKFMGSDDYHAIFTPAIDLEYKQRAFFVYDREAMMVPYEGAGVKVFAGQDYSAGISLTYDPGRKDIPGIQSLDWTTLGGIFAAYHPGILFVRGQLGYDMLNEFNGFKGEFGAGVAGPISAQWRGMAELSTAYAGENYLEQYFDAPGFNADSGFYRWRLTGALQYQFTQGAFVEGVASYDRLIGDAADSPLSQDDGQFSLRGLVGYHF